MASAWPPCWWNSVWILFGSEVLQRRGSFGCLAKPTLSKICRILLTVEKSPSLTGEFTSANSGWFTCGMWFGGNSLAVAILGTCYFHAFILFIESAAEAFSSMVLCVEAFFQFSTGINWAHRSRWATPVFQHKHILKCIAGFGCRLDSSHGDPTKKIHRTVVNQVPYCFQMLHSLLPHPGSVWGCYLNSSLSFVTRFQNSHQHLHIFPIHV